MNKYTQNPVNAPFLSTFISATKDGKRRPSLRFWRYACMISVHLLFVLSFRADIQILEGDITSSRLFGFHLSDPLMTLEVALAHGTAPTNLLIGAFTILFFYAFFAGRAFCAWVCPYNFFSEIAEWAHQKLVRKGVIKEREFDTRLRYALFASFCALTLASGYLIFELFNVVGVLSRFIIYGYSAAIWWVFLVLLLEVFFARRLWCRYICPIGTLYALLARFRAIKISWDGDKCDNCAACKKVCLVPSVIEMAKQNAEFKGEIHAKIQGGEKSGAEFESKNGEKIHSAKNEFVGKKGIIFSGDCTQCGRCIDVCHTDALGFENRLKKLL